MYVVAVLEGTTRIGLVSAERELDVSGRGRAAATLQGAPEGYQLDTSLAPASLALPFEQTGAADPESFEIVAPSGQRLLSARVSPADLAATRTRWRDALQTITLAALAVWILLLAGPILDWRQAAPTGANAPPRPASSPDSSSARAWCSRSRLHRDGPPGCS